MKIISHLLADHRTPWFALVASMLVTLLVYLPGLRGPFAFDDQVNLLGQPAIHIQSLDLDSLNHAARARDSISYQRAIPMVSFALNYYVSGFNPLTFKAINLAIHLLCGVGLFVLTRLLLRLVQARLPTPPFSESGLVWISLAVAGLWIVHPLNLTTVLYVVQRMTSLASLFVILGLIGYLIGRQRILEGRRGGYVWIIGSIVACTPLAILSKESGILLPAFMILIEISFLRLAASNGQTGAFRVFWLAVVLFPVVAGLAYGLWKANAMLALDVYAQREFTLGERLLTEARVLWFYLRLILLPDIRDMGLFHDDISLSRGWLDPITTFPAVLGIGAMVLGGLLTLRRWPMIGFVPLWFVLGHSVESTVIPLEIAHDHRNHLPMYSVLLGLVWHLCLPWKQFSRRPYTRYALVVAFFAILAAGTYARATFWQDAWSLATQDAINHPKSARAHTSLAIELHKHRLDEDAHRHFERAASLRPEDTTTIIRLVQHLHLTAGRVPEHWIKELERRMMLYPSTVAALWVYEPLVRATRDDTGVQDRIMRVYEMVAERRDLKIPADWRSKVQYLIAVEATERKNYPEALRRLDRARELQPTNRQLLLAAEIYLKQHNLKKVRELTDPVMTYRDTLPQDLRSRLDALRAATSNTKTP